MAAGADDADAGRLWPILTRVWPAAPPCSTAVSAASVGSPELDERDLLAAGVDVQTVEYVALGGGIGSFAWVSLLRNSGVSPQDILVVGNDERPYSRLQLLCEHSQIAAHDRLRSNSDACPDNLWGFPGYATREVLQQVRRARLGAALSVLWSILCEPVFADTYTPLAGNVYAAIDREAARIGWASLLRRGQICAIRKSSAGRLLVLASTSDAAVRKQFAVSARFLHLAAGYAGVRFLPDLVAYRERTGDRSRVVNAYEEHQHVYAHLREHGGTVLIRGRGIVAMRILQRLWEERRHNASIAVVHLHRTRLTAGQRGGVTRRVVEEQFEFQPFNWPKASWGGELRQRLEYAAPEERARLLRAWGGTTVPRNRTWRRIVRAGRTRGWYRQEFGIVQALRPDEDGRVITRIESSLVGGGVIELATDFIIDCTGMEAAPEYSAPVADLVRTYAVPLNSFGRLTVNGVFEVEAMRHGDARLFTTGALAAGGPFAGVDSFLGHQYAALRTVDLLQPLGAKGLRRLNGLYSFWQWLKWVRQASP